MPDHLLGEETLTKHEEAIRQLYKEARFMPAYLAATYGVGDSIINRKHQPTNEEEMRAVVTEEWNAIPQEWINKF